MSVGTYPRGTSHPFLLSHVFQTSQIPLKFFNIFLLFSISLTFISKPFLCAQCTNPPQPATCDGGHFSEHQKSRSPPHPTPYTYKLYHSNSPSSLCRHQDSTTATSPSLACSGEPNHQTNTTPCYFLSLLSSNHEHQTQMWSLHCILAIVTIHHLLRRVLIYFDQGRSREHSISLPFRYLLKIVGFCTCFGRVWS